MEKNAIVNPYVDLRGGEVGNTAFFFLQHILMARADLHMESGQHEYDQEVNVYLSGLLNSIVDAGQLTKAREYISIFDVDVRRYLDEHPGVRNEYVVYRDNADFGLVQEGVFQGDRHQGSYHHIVFQDASRQDRIVVYYKLAASALSHLQGTHGALVPVFMALAEQMSEVLQIVRRAAGYYFEMLERMTDGSLFHLEREMNEQGAMKMYQEKLDEFLKVYGECKARPDNDLKERLMTIARELAAMNERFRFEELKE
ncbi:MAG: hypothetical protein JXA71_13390 [Chitinispirillaceae bacterium]|nr:hypothetical protein [Chitinispirillaceae bacterium]